MNYTRRFVKEYYAAKRAFPNVQSLDVRPGTVLTASGSDWVVEGALHQFIPDGEPLKALVQAAIARLTPGGGAFSGPTSDLEFISTGTTMVSAGLGGEIEVPGVAGVKVKLLVSFSDEGEYYFDTAEPGRWHTFDPTESHYINTAALRFLSSGSYVVTSVAWCPKWTWGVSRKSGSKVGFSGAADIPAIDVSKIADILVNTDLNVTYDSAAALRDTQTNSVACFACVKRTTVWFKPSVETESFTLNAAGLAEAGPAAQAPTEVVVEATAADLFPD